MAQSQLVAQAFAEEQTEYWPMHYELLAVIAEQQSALLVAFLRAYGATGVSPPLKVPRPGQTLLGQFRSRPDTQVASDDDNVISFREFMQRLR